MANSLLVLNFILLAFMAVMASTATTAQASCTVDNISGTGIVIVPVSVTTGIHVDVGTTVTLPLPQQTCYLRNTRSGRQLGPFIFPEGGLVVISDSVSASASVSVAGCVDVHTATSVNGAVSLGISICLNLC